MELVTVFIFDCATLEVFESLCLETAKEKHEIEHEKSIRYSTNGVKSRVLFRDKTVILSVLHR